MDTQISPAFPVASAIPAWRCRTTRARTRACSPPWPRSAWRATSRPARGQALEPRSAARFLRPGGDGLRGRQRCLHEGPGGGARRRHGDAHHPGGRRERHRAAHRPPRRPCRTVARHPAPARRRHGADVRDGPALRALARRTRGDGTRGRRRGVPQRRRTPRPAPVSRWTERLCLRAVLDGRPRGGPRRLRRRRLRRVGRWQPHARDRPQGQTRRTPGRRRRRLRAVSLHLERVRRGRPRSALAGRERRLRPELRADGDPVAALRPDRRACARSSRLAPARDGGRARRAATTRDRGERTRPAARRGPRVLPEAPPGRRQRREPDPSTARATPRTWSCAPRCPRST